MVLCSPFRPWKFHWSNADEPKDPNDRFLVQYNSWWSQHRILVRSKKTVYQVAQSNTKADILKDWDFLLNEFAKEVKQVGSVSFSEHHLISFLEGLVKTQREKHQENDEHRVDPNDLDVDRRRRDEFINLQQLAVNEEDISLARSDLSTSSPSSPEQGTTSSSTSSPPLTSSSEKSLSPSHCSPHLELSHHHFGSSTHFLRSTLGEKVEEETELMKAVASMENKSQISKLLHQYSSSSNPTLDQYLNARNSRGLTALHILSSFAGEPKDTVEVVKLLLQKGANVLARDTDGWTPLHACCQAGNLQMATLLLKARAPVLALTRDGTLPFNYLVRHSYPEKEKIQLQLKVLETMLESGVSVNSQNHDGNSVLHYA
eukprot:TRINITY_DN7631_c0_g1_i1.p1 TRINITY_DN7631_c0_g1~~TRINITY_DN7631_c0_g1_i1.p1  ORF type:complete len:373 (-),score=85.01 TRINITY_DN7631_c0_g1_i1:225-1343(-)